MTLQRYYRNDYFVFYCRHTVNSRTGIKSLTAGRIKKPESLFFFFPHDASGCIVDVKRHEYQSLGEGYSVYIDGMNKILQSNGPLIRVKRISEAVFPLMTVFGYSK